MLAQSEGGKGNIVPQKAAFLEIFNKEGALQKGL